MIRNPIQWPNGARCACAITFDVDADSLIHISRPDDGHRRLYPISMGRYGPNSAVPRILETYRRLGLRQSFFMPGWVMEQYPETVEAILSDGHEIGHHGYLHEDPAQQNAEEQSYWFERALEVHRRLTGKTPRGYRAPVYNVTPEVLSLAVQHGLTYESSMMADDLPYRIDTEAGSLIELPVHWGNDDWPPFAHYDEIGYKMPVMSPRRGLEASFRLDLSNPCDLFLGERLLARVQNAEGGDGADGTEELRECKLNDEPLDPSTALPSQGILQVGLHGTPHPLVHHLTPQRTPHPLCTI